MLKSKQISLVKVKTFESLHSSQVTYQAIAFLWILYHEATRSVSTRDLSQWDASPLQIYPQH